MKIYKSKIGYGFLLIIFVIFTMVIGFMIFQGASKKELFVIIGLSSLTTIFILHLFFTTEYRIINEKLNIRCGFFYNKNLEIKKIISISKTNNPISAPAASLDRIELHYGEFSSVIISPKDKVNFVNELMKINSNIDNQVTENE